MKVNILDEPKVGVSLSSLSVGAVFMLHEVKDRVYLKCSNHVISLNSNTSWKMSEITNLPSWNCCIEVDATLIVKSL